MGKYVHEKKKLHISRHRRKENGTSRGLQKDTSGTDRRHEKERVGIILQDYDRRKEVDPKHSDEEKRSGKNRRGGKDRRG